MPLPTPQGRQLDVLYLKATGHNVVLGTAGSGKTTLAILRSAWLSGKAPGAGRTMLVTYNKVLATVLDVLGEDQLPEVEVRNYHQFARGYLVHRGKLPQGTAILDHPPRLVMITQAVHNLLSGDFSKSKILKAEPSALAEELTWISRMGITTEEAYKEATRVNRGGLVVAGDGRAKVWRLYEEYRRLRTEGGFTYDWDDIAITVLEELKKDQSDRLYRHIVIDEGQDFSPTMLKSLVAAVPSDGSVTFFGDMAQQIYGGRISWRDAGLKVPHGVHKFEENYRNTKQVADLALALANGPHFRGDPDMVEPKTPKAQGVPPTLVKCATPNDEIALAVRQAAGMARDRRVAILLRVRTNEDDYLNRLRAQKVPVERLHRKMNNWALTPGVWLGTYHSAKGLEFDAVILPHLNEGMVPDMNRVTAIGDDEQGMAEEARLLYVGITRAKAQLVMTYSGSLTSLIEPLDKNLYVSAKA